jgi:HD superfamily phosphodiesterase
MPISEKIASSEARYRFILEEFFNRIFAQSFLPSHGIDHHRRVWLYAKELLSNLQNQGFYFDQSFSDKLIIACYLHDSGMSVESGFNHGAEGRKICERFLSENNLPVTELTELLQAIEIHDNKEYKSINKPEDLLTILSVADDLDAFGFIGIYRYLEIYIKRNKPLNKIGILIKDNCENRYQNFIVTYRFYNELIERHSGRFEILASFFNSYNQQALYYKFDNLLIAGHCGIAEIISAMMQDNESYNLEFSRGAKFPDPIIQWFFNELNVELSEFSQR